MITFMHELDQEGRPPPHVDKPSCSIFNQYVLRVLKGYQEDAIPGATLMLFSVTCRYIVFG